MPGAASKSTRTDRDIDSTTKPKSVSAAKRPAADAEMEEKAARTQAPMSVQPVEPEDAYLTGVSRSLQRRLLGLNVEGARPQTRQVPGATVAGIHSTGSFTGTTSPPAKDPKHKTKQR